MKPNYYFKELADLAATVRSEGTEAAMLIYGLSEAELASLLALYERHLAEQARLDRLDLIYS